MGQPYPDRGDNEGTLQQPRLVTQPRRSRRSTPLIVSLLALTGATAVLGCRQDTVLIPPTSPHDTTGGGGGGAGGVGGSLPPPPPDLHPVASAPDPSPAAWV